MSRLALCWLAALPLAVALTSDLSADGRHWSIHQGHYHSGGPLWPRYQVGHWNGRNYPQPDPHSVTWHGGYSHVQYGTPVSLVLPPSVQYQGHYSWGMPSTHTSPVNAQFGRLGPSIEAYPGTGMYPLPTTPMYPSHTDMFGVYPVRAPWW